MKLKLIFLPVLAAIVSLSFPFVFWPEMLNWPFILDRGWLPYKDFSIIHTPLLPLILMILYKIFGFSPLVLKFFGVTLFSLTNFLVVLLAWKLTKKMGLVFLVGFLQIFLTVAFEGNTVWFESLLVPILILIFWLQISYLEKEKFWKIFFSGLLMGLIFLIKQTAFFIAPEFLIFIGYLVFVKKNSARKLLKIIFLFIAPLIILVGFFLGALWWFNLLTDFYHWGVRFVFLLPTERKPGIEPDLLLPNLRQILMLIFFIFLAIWAVIRNKNFINFFALYWMFLSLFFAFPRFEYFHLLPTIAFFLIILAPRLHWLILLLIIFLIAPVFRNTYLIGQRFLNNEVVETADWLKKNYPDGSIFSLNGPDLIYFLTRKPPAVKPWVDQLPWELEFGLKEFTTAFIARPPEIIVHRPYLDKSVKGLGAYRPEAVYQFMLKNYRKIKIFPGGVEVWERS